jgi:putative ABC transport system substrate-binding protein
MITRRELLMALVTGALARVFNVYAQPPGKVWRIGLLLERPPSDHAPNIAGFKAGMSELGYAEGKDYVFEQRSAQGVLGRLPALAVELVALNVDLIYSTGTPSAVAARNATRDIPILIITVGDPIGAGLAATLARPGGNVTGLTGLSSELLTKRLDLLHQLVPGMRRVALLYDPDNAADALSLKQFESGCAKLALNPMRAPVRKAEEIIAAFNTLKRDNAQGLIVTNSTMMLVARERIIEQAAKHRLPAIYGSTQFAESGGLMTYSANTVDLNRRVAAYAVKIFKGAKPSDLPIEQPTKFDLVLNMKTAKGLGIKFPQNILVLANKVIE